MATSVSTPRPVGGPLVQTKVLVLENTATNQTRNITAGPSTLFTVLADNQQAAASNTKVWVKLYDDISDGWTPGTTQAVIGFPIAAWTAADDSQFKGTYQLMHTSTGLRFEKGISAAASQEAGDEATAAPATDVGVEFTHS